MTKEKFTHGIEVITKHLVDIPNLPGVYKMIDVNDEIIYIGKARDLKKRIESYTNPRDIKTQAMVSSVSRVEIIVTKTETQSILLEGSLVKTNQPHYNILLKDDKSFPYISITTTHPFPAIVKHRGKQIKGNQYFGPFANTRNLYETISALKKIFLIRSCSDNEFKNRKRPCIEYQIKRCSAPCVLYSTQEEYKIQIMEALDFFAGKSTLIQDKLIAKMNELSEDFSYEKAAIIRDRIKALTSIQMQSKITLDIQGNADIIAIYKNGHNCCIEVFFVRNGQNFGNKAFFPKMNIDDSEEEILEAFISQFYQTNTPGDTLIVNISPENQDILEKMLCDLAEKKVSIIVPKKKNDLLEVAIDNAKEELAKNVAEKQSFFANLSRIKDIFNLSKTPERIEVYDNSHISGTNSVGVMIVAGREGFLKQHYRKFNVVANDGDDYHMMKEVLTRRFARLDKEEDGIYPDLLLIDGGLGHKSIVASVLREANLIDKVPFVCISKGPDRNAGREEFHMMDKEAFRLDKNDPVLYFLQNLRDEAHRFAISTHRKKRGASATVSIIDEIPNIGPKRKKLLLTHFGSVKMLMEASLEDLVSVSGINQKVATDIFNFLHEK